MPRIWTQKSSFSAGEISPELLGRGDLRAYENGALRLRNVFIQPTGGVTRRHGFRFVDIGSGPGRLIAFEFNTEQVYLLVFSDQRVDVYRDGWRVADFEAPWTLGQLGQINWTQSADTLLVVHPDVAPRRITRSSHVDWDLVNWVFHASGGRVYTPHYKFAAAAITLQPTATTGFIGVIASSSVFTADHVGVRLRIKNKEVQIATVLNATTAQANVVETLVDTLPTTDWTEEAWSNARGWPVSVCFHQDRLVIGGSRDLPNRLWLSKSADLFNFDLGDGLDDEAIEFPILSDQVNAIRHVFSGRHLQVFTSGAEWMVTGDPLTPTSIQLFRQTRVGSPVDRTVPPRDVDGATLFVPRAGPQLREFLFTDTEQAYQANDLAMLSHHLIDRPVDMSYDESRRLLHVVMTNGAMATLTAYREEQVSGWTLQKTDGAIRSVATVGESTYALVERLGGVLIEVLDEAAYLDSALSGTSETPKQEWSGAGHLEGRTVKIVADGSVVPDAIVQGGSITLDQPARSVQMGLPFTHVIEPLPPSMQAISAGQGGKLRPISITLRVWETSALYLDAGRGLLRVALKRLRDRMLDPPPFPFSGDVTVRTLGWRDTGIAPLWRIEQDVPLPFTLLSVSTELSVTG
jgi:hypothetical protein